MSQKIEEQIATIERALGERMVEHALVIVRSWLSELGENNPYEEAFASIQTRNKELFGLWLSSNNDELDARMDELTGEMYQMVDAVYADLRLKRGLSPEMHGFNKENPQSVMNYFQNCARFRPEDLEWFHDILQDEQQSSIALMAIAALAMNVRQYFSVDGFMALIDGMNATNETAADQCIANAMLLLVHYDVRTDYFPQIQDAFAQAVADMNDAGECAFSILCGIIESTKKHWLEMATKGGLTVAKLPSELQKLIKDSGLEEEIGSLLQWMPTTESDYMVGLIEILPETWLYSMLVEGNEAREKALVQTAVDAGYREMMWADPQTAEQVFRTVLRKGAKTPKDYINYAHCQLLRGDRVMAFENYHQARKLCKSPKEFFNLFRPDRRQLVDCGVPIEQVYMIEDQLLNN